MGREVAVGDAFGDQRDERLTRFSLKAVMELSQVSIALGSIGERRDAGGESRAPDHLGDMPHDAIDPLAGRAAHDVGSARRLASLSKRPDDRA